MYRVCILGQGNETYRYIEADDYIVFVGGGCRILQPKHPLLLKKNHLLWTKKGENVSTEVLQRKINHLPFLKSPGQIFSTNLPCTPIMSNGVPHLSLEHTYIMNFVTLH